MSDVIIIGAGITGLSCAWRLKRLGIEPIVLESSLRPGGVIKSERVGDYLVERGPNSFLPSADNFTLLDESGLSNELIEANPKAPRYVLVERTLRRIPLGPMTFRGLLRATREPFIRSKSAENESVHDFFARRFGQEVQDRLVAPFVTGIYAGNTKELGMAATFPKFVKIERENGSLVLGMMKEKKPRGTRGGHSCSFREGMETLTRRLASDANITYQAEEVHVDQKLNVKWSSGGCNAKAVIVTAPASRAAGILKDSLPDVARLLENVEYAPMVIATTSVPDSAFPQPLRGFGFLVPRSEKLHLLGTLFSSALFPGRAPTGRQLLTSFIGGVHERDAVQWTQDRVWDAIRRELQSILGTSVAPEPIDITRHTQAIPQYKIGHEHWTAALKKELQRKPGLFLAGNYMDGVAVGSCMETGERIAREAAAFIGSKS